MAICKCPKCNGSGKLTDIGAKAFETALFGGVNLLMDFATGEESHTEICDACGGKGFVRD